MNIISQFNEYVEKSFNDYLIKYYDSSNYLHKTSDFNNYYSFMKDLFGEINFKRRYYFDKTTNEWFFFTDLFFNFPKKKHFDPLVCAEIFDAASSNSYSKADKIVADKIGEKFNNNINLSRATIRNIIMNFNFEEDEIKEQKRIEKLFVMLDEKFVGSQFNKGKDHMIKASIVFEGIKTEYNYKKKENSKNRHRLINPFTNASIEDELILDTVNYIYNTYDTDYLKEIYFMGDCAKWIKSFPKSQWFKFNPDICIYSTTDGFHPVQAINQLATKSHYDFRDSLLDLIMNNDKELFKDACLSFMGEHKERTTTIITKMEYILNNWDAMQLYINNDELSCSMESHISHNFADLFSSRPKAYSKRGLYQLLKLRLLNCNKVNIKEYYLKNFNKINDKQNTCTNKGKKTPIKLYS